MEEQEPKENYTFASNESTKTIQLTNTIISCILPHKIQLIFQLRFIYMYVCMNIMPSINLCSITIKKVILITCATKHHNHLFILSFY